LHIGLNEAWIIPIWGVIQAVVDMDFEAGKQITTIHMTTISQAILIWEQQIGDGSIEIEDK
jgi:hypothetical protein